MFLNACYAGLDFWYCIFPSPPDSLTVNFLSLLDRTNIKCRLLKVVWVVWSVTAYIKSALNILHYSWQQQNDSHSLHFKKCLALNTQTSHTSCLEVFFSIKIKQISCLYIYGHSADWNCYQLMQQDFSWCRCK